MLSQAWRPANDSHQPSDFFRALNAAAVGPPPDITSVLQGLVERLGWEWYAVWVTAPHTTDLECLAAWSRRPHGEAVPPAVGERSRVGEGVVGRAWQGALDIGSAEEGCRVGVAIRIDSTPVAVFEFGLPISPPEVPAELASVLSECGEGGFAYLFLVRRHTLNPQPLSAIEQQVLQWAAEGFSLREIASLTDLSDDIVKSHFERMYLKLGVSGRAGAVAQGFRRNLLR